MAKKPEEASQISPWVDQSLRSLEKKFGGRESVVEALSYLPEEQTKGLLRGLRRFPNLSLAEACARYDVSMWKLFQMVKEGDLARAQVAAYHEVSKRLPDVVQDVMRKATDYKETCRTCLGCGQILYEPSEENPNPEPQECPDCGGMGEITCPAVKEDREYALKLGGLLKPSGGVNVAVGVKQDVHLGKPGASLDRLVEMLDRQESATLSEDDVRDAEEVRDAEVVKEDPPDAAV